LVIEGSPSGLSVRNEVKAEAFLTDVALAKSVAKVRAATRGAVAPGYPLQSFCPCCFGLEGKKDFRFYPCPMPVQSSYLD
jgi:hypothetical protein